MVVTYGYLVLNFKTQEAEFLCIKKFTSHNPCAEKRGSITTRHVKNKWRCFTPAADDSPINNRHFVRFVRTGEINTTPNAGLMFGQRLRRWPSIRPALGDGVLAVGIRMTNGCVHRPGQRVRSRQRPPLKAPRRPLIYSGSWQSAQRELVHLADMTIRTSGQVTLVLIYGRSARLFTMATLGAPMLFS